MNQDLHSFFRMQKADYAIELAVYALIWLGLGLAKLFGGYVPAAKGGIVIIVVWGILLWRRFMTFGFFKTFDVSKAFDFLKKWPSAFTSWIDQWENKRVAALSIESENSEGKSSKNKQGEGTK